MAKDNRIRLPSSEGGIVRYYDNEYPSKIILKPIYIIVLTVAICVIGLAIKFLL